MAVPSHLLNIINIDPCVIPHHRICLSRFVYSPKASGAIYHYKSAFSPTWKKAPLLFWPRPGGRWGFKVKLTTLKSCKLSIPTVPQVAIKGIQSNFCLVLGCVPIWWMPFQAVKLCVRYPQKGEVLLSPPLRLTPKGSYHSTAEIWYSWCCNCLNYCHFTSISKLQRM